MINENDKTNDNSNENNSCDFQECENKSCNTSDCENNSPEMKDCCGSCDEPCVTKADTMVSQMLEKITLLETQNAKLIGENNGFKRELSYALLDLKRSQDIAKKEYDLSTNKLIKKYSLSIINSLDMLKKAVAISEEGNTKDGLLMVIHQMSQSLEEFNIKEMDNYDKFDATLHEVVGTIPGEIPNIIIEVKSSGYMFNDFLIKPAQVIISVAK